MKEGGVPRQQSSNTESRTTISRSNRGAVLSGGVRRASENRPHTPPSPRCVLEIVALFYGKYYFAHFFRYSSFLARARARKLASNLRFERKF